MELIYSYKRSDTQTYEEFWDDLQGDFDNEDETHVSHLMQSVQNELCLDEYALKRLETCIKTELPFFAKKRLLAKKWLMENFIY